MPKYIVPLLTLGLVLATAAQAQSPGGHGRGGGRGGGSQPSGSSPPATNAPPPVPPPKRENQIEIIGVVRAIGPGPDRITISYEAVDELGWPAGTMPFAVYKTVPLANVTIGEKVRFRLDSQQITELKPF